MGCQQKQALRLPASCGVLGTTSPRRKARGITVMIMTTTEETAIVQKTRELCETIVAQPEFQAMRKQIDQFMGDEEAKSQYQTVMEKGEMLQQKQQIGAPLETGEVDDFNKHRDVLINNPVARGFLDAQQAMQEVQRSIGQYVAKTFELGRAPTEEDMSGCCSDHGGCGCSH
jgi:cell fate (sporulation/competence/biofilm development) regulator YlbF (YheA/YmcA/DUF963 family)